MNVRRWTWSGVVALVLLGALGLLVEWPTSEAGYRTDAVAAAQESLSATGTAVLVGRAELTGDVFGTYSTVALTTALEAAATAVQSILDADLPGPAAAQLRTGLQPVLLAAADGIAELIAALDGGDDATAAQVLTALDPVAAQLQRFVETNQ